MRTLETRYALALFELIRDEEGLQAAAALLQKEPSLWQALNDPCVPRAEKDRVLCAVFGGNDEDGYRYVIGSRKADVRALAKEFNAAFDGKGGGRPEMVQGTANGKSSAMREWILEKAGNL